MTARVAWGVRDLSVRHGARVALDAVTLSVPAGGVRPDAGDVSRPARRRIGYVCDARGVYEDLTVAENIDFVAAAYGVRNAASTQRARELLARSGLDAACDRLSGRLSGGMRQKLAFTLAVLHEPELLVLDEPTTGVDPVSRADLWRLIAGAAAGGAGVIVSTTYLDEAQRAARVALLDDGRLRAVGTPDEIAAELPSGSRGSADRGRCVAVGEELAAAHALTRRFGGLTAVDAVDLQVRAGEVVGLLGANGAGKTTLIRLLLGLVPPTSGNARLFGRAPSRATRGRLGYVPQSLGLWDDLTVAENAAFSAQAFHSPTPALEPDLATAAGTLVRDLPLGLRRRLAFAAALAHNPEVLVLDEPTSGVDPEARAALWDTIHSVAGGGVGVLVTTHHMDEAEECDRLVVMTNGRVAAEGTVADIVGDSRTLRVDTDDWAGAFAALDAAGLPVALVGRSLRVPGGDETRVRAALDSRHIAARLDLVPATFEETFVLLARADERPAEDGSSAPPPSVDAPGAVGESVSP